MMLQGLAAQIIANTGKYFAFSFQEAYLGILVLWNSSWNPWSTLASQALPEPEPGSLTSPISTINGGFYNNWCDKYSNASTYP